MKTLRLKKIKNKIIFNKTQSEQSEIIALLPLPLTISTPYSIYRALPISSAPEIFTIYANYEKQFVSQADVSSTRSSSRVSHRASFHRTCRYKLDRIFSKKSNIKR